MLKLFRWVLYCKKVVQNKAVEKLISILEESRNNSVVPYMPGKMRLLYSASKEIFTCGCFLILMPAVNDLKLPL